MAGCHDKPADIHPQGAHYALHTRDTRPARLLFVRRPSKPEKVKSLTIIFPHPPFGQPKFRRSVSCTDRSGTEEQYTEREQLLQEVLDLAKEFGYQIKRLRRHGHSSAALPRETVTAAAERRAAASAHAALNAAARDEDEYLSSRECKYTSLRVTVHHGVCSSAAEFAAVVTLIRHFALSGAGCMSPHIEFLMFCQVTY